MEFWVNNTRILLKRDDITKQDTEAIVNAANSSLLGGGGVDGAIHRAGGPKILEECKQIRARQGGCPTGEAVITTGGNLPARYVIHTVGPVWHGGRHGEADLLRNAYKNSLLLAKEKGIRSISFPSISTGAYRFPIEQAAGIAVASVQEFAAQNIIPTEIRFVLFSDEVLLVYRLAWEKALQ
ncbi:O-acetyl-ADP-ribose deacetylase [Desulfoscipio geothermicus]|uniref:O-acetyl-ADP-ribose deacetylase (Regulator of RNase III), contains Macro domain n=1 Tax=Desulfoscipio geothermicus DSM 3669 TaxID=1121426 RepID=A0A1I6E5R6_9FIRM|nr:O-acetyl-ADP-ribose deacetylase [Desulfoscipio geothermicus]SFR12882.1 O-acetyl-ADP-ribose deacetylase (regulator of RNase III), contains Macro domain [Desulfoscipio geothermicus DSM 3669]